MKTLISVLAIAGTTLVLTYAVVSKSKQARFEREKQALFEQWESDQAQMNAQLANAKRRSGRVETIVTPGAPALPPAHSPEEHLENLQLIKVSSSPDRGRSIRHIQFHLESLVQSGAAALPPIQGFLERFEDVDYAYDTREGGGEIPAEEATPVMTGLRRAAALLGRRGEPKIDFDYPPTLRLGLMDVLGEIGGIQAEAILAEILSTSGRGIEIAYASRSLEQLAPGKYSHLALSAAKDLLLNPPQIERPSRLDENAQAYLFALLRRHNDTSFAAIAQQLLLDHQGRLDQPTLDYLTSTAKEQAVPALYQAYKDPRLTNLTDRASIARQALAFAGTHPQANQLFHEIVQNETIPNWMRAMTIQSIAGGRGEFFGGEALSDPAQIESRIQLLQQTQIADERMSRARDEAIQRLNRQLQGDTGPAPQTGGGIVPEFFRQ
jgi:hypothetical protein